MPASPNVPDLHSDPGATDKGAEGHSVRGPGHAPLDSRQWPAGCVEPRLGPVVWILVGLIHSSWFWGGGGWNSHLQGSTEQAQAYRLCARISWYWRELCSVKLFSLRLLLHLKFFFKIIFLVTVNKSAPKRAKIYLPKPLVFALVCLLWTKLSLPFLTLNVIVFRSDTLGK